MLKEGFKHKILIVDDIAENIDVLNNVLKPHYRRAVALNGERALKIAQSSDPPDLILLDIMMPGMDGYEVCQKLREDPDTRQIPVIFVTAKDKEDDETKGFEVGAVDYITKPIRPAVVLARVRTHLRLKDAQALLKKQNEELKEYNRLRDDVERITRHDLKSPLNVVIAAPQIILEHGDLDEKQKSMLGLVEQAGLRMLDMVNHSLDMYKMETGRYHLQPVEVDVLKVIRQVCADLKRSGYCGQVDISIMVNGAPERLEESFVVWGEDLLFYSLISNLLKNAVEASSKGDMVTVNLDRAEHGPEIKFHNPAQVPAQIASRFFEKYTTYGKHSGTGLGTYSARLIVQTMGGSIAMQTGPEQGTRITIVMPNTPQVAKPEKDERVESPA